MAEYNKASARFGSLGYTVVALSVDAPAHARRVHDALQLDFTLLCDPSHDVVTSLGLLNKHERGGIAIPATLVVDRERRLIFSSVGNVVVRSSALDVLEHLAHIENGTALGKTKRRAVMPQPRDFYRALASLIGRS